MERQKKIFLPAEWHSQSAIQLTWPHNETDWHYMIDEITVCFVNIARSILDYQKLLIVCKDAQQVKQELGNTYCNKTNLRLIELPSNDTWARDHAGISLINNKGDKFLLDFTFNGWGLKFPADQDNQINRRLYAKNIFADAVQLIDKKNLVLEGGGIESDGKGTILTTSKCLLSPNRNAYLEKNELENTLKETLGAERILWLESGYLKGDDTDSHIDTLARFCDEYTIAYVKCEDHSDEHYEALLQMEKELQSFVDNEGSPYRLIALPMADKVLFEGERLPATYANFLIMNKVVLMPSYGSRKDTVAKKQLQKAFPSRKIIQIDCLPIIKQHGSLHCLTMQYPEGFL